MALTASSMASVSAQPSLLSFSVSSLPSAAGALAQAATVNAHFLDAQGIEVAKLGVTSGIDRFAQAQSGTRLESGQTVYDGLRAWVRCESTERVPAGESTVYVARDVNSDVERDVAPSKAGGALVYRNRTWHNLGGHSSLGS